jgi:carbon-monoxide dehydrogenase small subunit
MIAIVLTVNGALVEAPVEPRTHLADFLREQQRLTGTHLGCEQGVCGACTILLDGAPARSCLTFAVACNGKDVRTVEGFDGDELMAQLREAFGAEHALQCGFCTPGMLISAYDLVRRLPGADEPRIRRELSGNLCRCTGYMGIVAAVKRVAAARAERTPSSTRIFPPPPAGEGRVGELSARPPSPSKSATSAPHLHPPPQAGEEKDAARIEGAPLEPGWTRIADRFLAEKPLAELWSLFADVPQLVGCLPGAVLEESDGHHLKGRMQVKLGPITATFSGSATHERDDATMTGVLAGSGGDPKSNSQARGRISYRLFPEEGGRRTRVELTLDFVLQGMLAQFSRSGLIRDFIGRMVRVFATNLARRVSGIAAVETAPSAAPAAAPHTVERPSSAPEPPPIRLGSLIWSVIWARIKALFGR